MAVDYLSAEDADGDAIIIIVISASVGSKARQRNVQRPIRAEDSGVQVEKLEQESLAGFHVGECRIAGSRVYKLERRLPYRIGLGIGGGGDELNAVQLKGKVRARCSDFYLDGNRVQPVQVWEIHLRYGQGHCPVNIGHGCSDFQVRRGAVTIGGMGRVIGIEYEHLHFNGAFAGPEHHGDRHGVQAVKPEVLAGHFKLHRAGHRADGEVGPIVFPG